MSTQQPPQAKGEAIRKLRPVYWVAAAAMAISVVFEAMESPPDWMAIAGRGALIAALVLLATAKAEETRAKKVLIYALSAVALGLLLARIMNR
jgi:hypothetical protein